MNRRDFLRLSGATAFGFALPRVRSTAAARPLPPGDASALDAIYTGRVTTDYLRVFRTPSFDSRQTGWFGYDALLPIFSEVAGESRPGHPNTTWFETHYGFVYSADVVPTQPRTNPVVSRFPTDGLGAIGEITVPYSDAICQADQPGSFAYRLYSDGVFWVTGLARDVAGAPLYRLYDERLGLPYYVPAEHVRIVPPEERAPISPDATDKRIVVDLHVPQRLTAYEGKAEVFSTLISGGRYRFEEDVRVQGGFRTLTPEGSFQIERKKPSRHMGAGEFASEYELPGVGWVSYIHWRGYAFHSTYWHNDYGYPRSAGCINMTLADARWLFRWSAPLANYREELTVGAGTRVKIG